MNIHGPFFVDENCNDLDEVILTVNIFASPKPYLDSIKCFTKQAREFTNIVPDGSIVIFQSDHGPEYQTMPKKIIGLNGEDYA